MVFNLTDQSARTIQKKLYRLLSQRAGRVAAEPGSAPGIHHNDFYHGSCCAEVRPDASGP